MNNILFIAYEFPPLNSGGVFRSLFFAKYFNDFNIKPFIVTLAPYDYKKIYRPVTTDKNLLFNIQNKNVDIIGVKSKDLLSKNKNKLKTFLDIFFNTTGSREYKYWKKDFFFKVSKIIANNKIDAILVTAPPFGVLFQAIKISKRFNLPLIIDMRDAWTLWNITPYQSVWHYKKRLQKERTVFKAANKIIVTSKQTISDFKLLHTNISPDKFAYIPNGYDDVVDFKPFSVNLSQKEKIIITYVGNFYYSPKARKEMFASNKEKKTYKKLQFLPRKEDWLYRSPYFFFSTIKKIFDTFPEIRNRIIIKFAGTVHNWLIEMIADFNLEKTVTLMGFVNKEQTKELQQSTDLLLITSSKVLNGKDYSIAGKTFEYFSFQKPILSFVTDGAQKDIIENSGLGVICNPDNIDESSNIILSLISKKTSFNPNKEFLRTLHRRKLTEKLSEIIKQSIFNNNER